LEPGTQDNGLLGDLWPPPLPPRWQM